MKDRKRKASKQPASVVANDGDLFGEAHALTEKAMAHAAFAARFASEGALAEARTLSTLTDEQKNDAAVAARIAKLAKLSKRRHAALVDFSRASERLMTACRPDIVAEMNRQDAARTVQ